MQAPELLALSEMRVSSPLCWQLHLAFVPAAEKKNAGATGLGWPLTKLSREKEEFHLGLLDLLFYVFVRPDLEEILEKASFHFMNITEMFEVLSHRDLRKG